MAGNRSAAVKKAWLTRRRKANAQTTARTLAGTAAAWARSTRIHEQKKAWDKAVKTEAWLGTGERMHGPTPKYTPPQRTWGTRDASGKTLGKRFAAAMRKISRARGGYK